MKKIIAFVLACLMTAPLFISCAETAQEDKVTTTVPTVNTSVTTPAVTLPPELTLELPELDYQGEVIRIISPDRSWFADEVSVAEKNADIINDAIYDRNANVEKRLNVKIENFKTGGTDNYAISNVIVRNSIKAGLDEYDIMVNRVYSSIIYTGDNLFHNLREMEHLNFEKAWWAQLFNEAASFGDKQWFVTGALSLSLRRFTFATFFNKNTFAANNLDDLYQVVRDGKWTIDYQHKIAQDLYKDLNGDNLKDENDEFGFVTNNTQIGVDPYWSALDLPILQKNADGFYTYALNIERTQAAVIKINNLMYNNPGVWGIKHGTSDGEQEVIAKKFSEGTAAMATLRLIEAEGSYIRGMEDEYGIIPMPKFDEAQEDYYGYAHDQFSAYAVPISVPDDRLQMIGAFLEAFSYQSHIDVTPAYYDVTLKTKLTRDEESAEMLDLIMANMKIDAGVLYTKNINSVHQMLRTVVAANNNNVTSIFTQLEKLASRLLDQMQELLHALP